MRRWRRSADGASYAPQQRAVSALKIDIFNHFLPRAHSLLEQFAFVPAGSPLLERTLGDDEIIELVPILEDYQELSTRSYFSFDEMMRCWARDVRNRKTGECYLRLVDDATIYDVSVQRSTPLSA